MTTPKQGILHDYDLHANHEPAAQKVTTCDVCGISPVTYQWSDYSGEAMCTRCGCPYQLKWGSEQQRAEGAYPYLNLRKEFLPVAQRYWKETGAFVHYGISLNRDDGVGALNAWLQKHKEDPDIASVLSPPGVA